MAVEDDAVIAAGITGAFKAVDSLLISSEKVRGGITIAISVSLPARRASKITPIEVIWKNREINIKKKAVRTSGNTRNLFEFY